MLGVCCTCGEEAEGLISRRLQDQLPYRLIEAMAAEIGPRLAGSKAEERAHSLARASGNR
jgi:hypothetical protein